MSYSVMLDLHLIFEPMMSDKGPGLIMTRVFTLPFVPSDGSKVWSHSWEYDSEPHGFELQDVTWDLDREVFLAVAQRSFVDFPLAGIPFHIQDYLDRGWRLGSWMEAYPDDDLSSEDAGEPSGCIAEEWQEMLDDNTYEHLHTLKARRRPASFNRFMKAMIRQMAETYNNSEVAYAMDKTSTFMLSQHETADPDHVSGWHQHADEYWRLPVDTRIKWMDKVREYPDLIKILRTPSAGLERSA